MRIYIEVQTPFVENNFGNTPSVVVLDILNAP